MEINWELHGKVEDIVCNYARMSARPEFYAGRGPCPSDMDGKKLYSIFRGLNDLNKEYGKALIRIVDKLEYLGATELLNALYDAADNNFVLKEEVKSVNDFPIKGHTDRERMQSAMISGLASLGIFDTCHNSEETRQNVTKCIRDGFYYELRKNYKDYIFFEDDLLKIIDPRNANYLISHKILENGSQETKNLIESISNSMYYGTLLITMYESDISISEIVDAVKYITYNNGFPCNIYVRKTEYIDREGNSCLGVYYASNEEDFEQLERNNFYKVIKKYPEVIGTIKLIENENYYIYDKDVKIKLEDGKLIAPEKYKEAQDYQLKK